MLAEVQKTSDHDTAFAAALLRPAMPTPAPVTAFGGKKADKRYDVYRNNVTVSLVNALADIFPAVQKIIGETNFRAIAREHVRASPPSSPLLFRYGNDFAAYLATLEPVRERMPYLPDVARIERAWLTAFHAADVPVADPATLAAIPADQIGDAVFTLHPATALMMSDFAIFEIFTMNRGYSDVRPIDLKRPQCALVTRPVADVQVTGIDHATGAFIRALMAEKSLGEAAGEASSLYADFDLGSALQITLQTGAFAAIETPPATSRNS